MKKLKQITLVFLFALFLISSGCKARVKDNVKTNRYENSVSYFQDKRTGSVFALVVIKTGVSASEEGVGLAYIPKSDINSKIISLIPNYTK